MMGMVLLGMEFGIGFVLGIAAIKGIAELILIVLEKVKWNIN